MSFPPGLICTTSLRGAGVPHVFLLICAQYYFSSMKDYCGIMWYVQRVVYYNTTVACSSNNTVKVYSFEYLLPVQVYLVKLTERAKSLHKRQVWLVNIEEIEIEGTLK